MAEIKTISIDGEKYSITDANAIKSKNAGKTGQILSKKEDSSEWVDPESIYNLSTYVKKSELADVATSGNYSDLSGTPTIGNATITIQKNSSTVDSFTTNATSGKTINITVSKSDVSLGNVTNDAQVKRSEMGVASGVATLGTDGKVPSSQLPSYVDDVLEYTAKSNFPTTGETGKIYVDTTTNLTYRWTGTTYVEISPSIALGETSSTAYAGDKGKATTDAFNTHKADTTIHITAAERNTWNAKTSNTGTVTSVNGAATSGSGLTLTGTVTTSGSLTVGVDSTHAVPTTTQISTWNGKQDAISDLSTIRTNATNGATAYGWGNHASAGYLKTHQDISGKADKASITEGSTGNSTATSGSTVTIPYVTVNSQGIVTGYGNRTHTITGFSNNAGTVTSVAMTTPTGLTVSGSPITSSGTLALTFTTGYSIPTTAKQTAWDGKQDAISDLATIRSNATNGNTAYGWGNHASAGYTKNIGTVTQVKIGTTAYDPTSGVISLPAYPTTLPASDVQAWAKAASKPSYSWDEITSKPSTFYTLPTANASTLGGVKSSTTGTTSGRDYAVLVNSDGTMKVNVPWTNTTYDLSPYSKTVDTVSALGVSGNNLTWTKNGTTNNITVPYATSAGSANSATTAGTCTGNAASASSVAWGNVSGRPTAVQGLTKNVGTATASGNISFSGASYDTYVVTLNGNVSGITLSAYPVKGHDCSVILYGNGVERTIVIANSGIYKTSTGEDLSLTVPAKGYAEVNFLYDGTNIWVRGV